MLSANLICTQGTCRFEGQLSDSWAKIERQLDSSGRTRNGTLFATMTDSYAQIDGRRDGHCRGLVFTNAADATR